MKLFDKIFGNKIKFVTATKIDCFMKFEQEFVFHKSMSEEVIMSCLKVKDYYPSSITTKRTKKFKSPNNGFYNTVSRERCVYMYDD